MLFFALCANMPTYAQKNKTKLTEEQQIAFDEGYINANKFLMLKMPDEALKELKKIDAIIPNKAAVHYLFAQIYLAKSAYTDAEIHALKATEQEPENSWYTKQLGEVYRLQKQYEKAGILAEGLYKKQPNDVNFLFDATYLYRKANKTDKALKLLTSAEKTIGLNEDIVKQKQSIYLLQNKVDKAIDEGLRLVKAFPRNTQYLGQLADIYLANGKEKEANNIYNTILQIEPDNGYALLAMADYYRNQKQYDLWFNNTHKAVSSQSLDVKTKMKAIVEFIPTNLFGEFHQNKCLELANAFTSSNPSEASAWVLLGDLHAQQPDYKTARENYNKASQIDPSSFHIWRQKILCNIELKDYQQLEIDCGEAIDFFPAEPLFYVYHAIASEQLKNYQKCLAVAQSGVSISEGQTQTLLQLYIIIGSVADKLKNYQTSDSAYYHALAIDPNNSLALNNYAYQLSIRKSNLEKAESMSKRSIELDPENASYYDTFGWICFIKQNYAEAKMHIEKSLQLEPNNSEVVEHYGDVLFKLGKPQEALVQWKKAKELGAETPLLDKKINTQNWHE